MSAMAPDRDPWTSTAAFAAAAAAVDAEREDLLIALSAAGRQAQRAESTGLLIDAFGRLNARCEELRAAFFPYATTLSIAHGTATTWSKAGVMRTVWRRELTTRTTYPGTRAIPEHEG